MCNNEMCMKLKVKLLKALNVNVFKNNCFFVRN